MNKILIVLLLTGVSGLVVVSTVFQTQEDDKGQQDLRVQRLDEASTASEEPLFPFDFALPDLDGETVTKADYEGKVLIVDIWGTWCPPCRMEIPHFVELHEKYKDQGFDIVGINYEGVPDEQAIPMIRGFVAANQMPYTCVLGDDATQQKIPGFNAFPTTLFLDRQGNVRKVLVGYHNMDRLDGIVTKLLSE